MFEILPGLFLILIFLFLACKLLSKIGKACGVSEVKSALSESLSIGSGRFPKQE